MRAVCCDAVVLDQTVVEENICLMKVLWTDMEHAPHAGQFYTLRAWGHDEEPFLSRPISVHSWDPEKHELQFLYQVKGHGTEKLAKLAAGDHFQVTGPMGNGFDTVTLAKEYNRILVVGGGIGTAPLYQTVRELAAAGNAPDVCFGFTDVPYETEKYEGFAKSLKIATDSGKAGVKGFVTQLYDPKDYDLVLLCGPTPMMKNAANGAVAAGAKCLCSLEAKMACGIGACLGCTCKTTREQAVSICKDGPVFDAKEVLVHV